MHTTKGGFRCLLVRQSNYFFAVFMSCGLCPSSLSGRAYPALQLAGRSFSSTFSSCFSLLLQGYVTLPFCLVPSQNCVCFQKIKSQYQLHSIAQKTESLTFIKKWRQYCMKVLWLAWFKKFSELSCKSNGS